MAFYGLRHDLYNPTWTPQPDIKAATGAGGVPVDAAAFCRESLGFVPDPRQVELLRGPVHRTLWNCGRQTGKSTMAGALALQRGLLVAESLILVVSPSGRQSRELLRKMKGMARRLGLKTPGDGDNEISLLLPRESRIVGIPGREETVRGFSSVNLMVMEEASRIHPELYQATRPMLAASNGDLLMMSTPWGKQGVYYDAWQNGGARWTRYTVKTDESPRISREFLEEEREVLGAEYYAQEYECVFTDSAHGVFDVQALVASIRAGVKSWVF